MEYGRINKTALTLSKNSSGRQQFSSLSSINEQSELLQKQKFMDYQTQIVSILTDLIRHYTSGDSSSVKDTTVTQILGSIYYALNAYTAHMADSNKLSDVLRKNGVRPIYNEGIQIIHTCFTETKKLFQNVAANKLAVPLTPYQDVLEHAIPEFLRTYDIQLNAQNTSCSMDYPVIFDDMTTEGIFYIQQYLEKLQIETEFCKLLNQQDILKTLCRYGKKFDMDIVNTPVNLFEILFEQLVFTVLSGNEKMNLTINPLQFQQMVETLSHMEPSEIEKSINDSVNKIVMAFQIKNQDLLAYMQRYQQQFTQRVIRANEHGNVSNIVLVEGENPDAGKNVFTDGRRMNRSNFARITELVANCDHMEERIKLIHDNIHSVKDYIDLLEADCLYGEDEFKALYDHLSDPELAILGRIIFSDELHQSRLHFTSSLFHRYKRELETDWKLYFVDFLSTISKKRRAHIEQLINHLIIKDDILY